MSDSQDHHDPMPQAPEAPVEGECCEGECGEACVWAQYYEARAEHARLLAEWRARHAREREGQG